MATPLSPSFAIEAQEQVQTLKESKVYKVYKEKSDQLDPDDPEQIYLLDELIEQLQLGNDNLTQEEIEDILNDYKENTDEQGTLKQ